jgi:hypothetical protein
MAEVIPVVNSISGTTVEPSAFSCESAHRAAAKSLDHSIKSALPSHRTLVPGPGNSDPNLLVQVYRASCATVDR